MLLSEGMQQLHTPRFTPGRAWQIQHIQAGKALSYLGPVATNLTKWIDVIMVQKVTFLQSLPDDHWPVANNRKTG